MYSSTSKRACSRLVNVCWFTASTLSDALADSVLSCPWFEDGPNGELVMFWGVARIQDFLLTNY